jgi:hypothetical protein
MFEYYTIREAYAVFNIIREAVAVLNILQPPYIHLFVLSISSLVKLDYTIMR